MANRKPAAPAPKRTVKTPAEIEAEKKRKAEARAAAQRATAEDEDDEEEAEADGDERDGDDPDDQRDGDDADDGDEDGNDERDGDDADEEDEADEEDGKRSGKGGKRVALTAAAVRKAAEEAVRKDRVRGAKIREVAAQFGFPKLGERHANGETSVRAFKDLVLERLGERQKKRGNTTFAAAGAPEIEPESGVRAQGGPAHARDFDKGAAEARALLGRK